MIPKVRVQAVEKERKGGYQFLMKPKLLSWNVRVLNEGDKCLRVRNLLREWKVDIVFKKLSLKSCLVVLCVGYGVASCGLVLFGL
jgi:hypothetical protein